MQRRRIWASGDRRAGSVDFGEEGGRKHVLLVHRLPDLGFQVFVVVVYQTVSDHEVVVQSRFYLIEIGDRASLDLEEYAVDVGHFVGRFEQFAALQGAVVGEGAEGARLGGAAARGDSHVVQEGIDVCVGGGVPALSSSRWKKYLMGLLSS